MRNSEVAIIMGSKSDIDIMQKASDMLDELEIDYTMDIFSAHRTLIELQQHIDRINHVPTFKVIITGAGMSNALAGAVAAQTIKPVISVPLSGGKFKGVESLLSSVEMPPGIPVLTVGIDAAKNAALAAASIIALYEPEVESRLCIFRQQQADKVLADNISFNNH